MIIRPIIELVMCFRECMFYGSVMAAGSPVPAGVPVEAVAGGIRNGVPGNPISPCPGRRGRLSTAV